ncbi:hypothetical protein TNCV_1076851 [Trichonephila clavipes]|uniref:Uncharacterized protein n=1 Tax=Trichonephila clavipes TaxID=2585209 RepID=A0A8X6RR43_TRICX|nr:hypothetical protein TNCV_1076851 [Trichonephila clavipes]
MCDLFQRESPYSRAVQLICLLFVSAGSDEEKNRNECLQDIFQPTSPPISYPNKSNMEEEEMWVFRQKDIEFLNVFSGRTPRV